MRKTLSFILAFLFSMCAISATALAKDNSKIFGELEKVIAAVDPDECIVVSISLVESDNCKKAHSWSVDISGYQEEELLSAIESDMDDYLNSIPDDISFSVEKKELMDYQVQIKIKAKNVYRLAEMPEVTRIVFVSDADGNYYDPTKYDPHFDRNDTDHFVKKDFLSWAEREGKDYNLDLISSKAEPYYEELRFHGGNATDRNFDWALIAVVLHPELIRDREEILYTDYTFFVYDNAADEFYPIDMVDVSMYDGLNDELLYRNITKPFGDVDEDNTVTVIDATLIQRSIVGLTSLPEDDDNYLKNVLHGIKYSDIDHDGERTVLDATGIQRNLAGLD